MKLPTVLPAAIAALALTSLASTVARSATPDRDYVTRAVPLSSGPHELFYRHVKVPKMPALAQAGHCREMMDRAAMTAMCKPMSDGCQPASPAPKG